MSTVHFLEIYSAHGDGGERGIGPVIGYCSTKSRADAIAKGKAWYGGNGFVGRETAVKIDGAVYVLASSKPVDLDSEKAAQDAAIKEAAIAKLSPEELRVLGLSKEPTP